MIVVSNTSPLNYLILVDAVHSLPKLFGNIVIPSAVCDELSDALAPDPVRHWIRQKPDWLLVQEVMSSNGIELNSLHRGEREAINLAVQLAADLIILDERPARKVAESCGLRVTGTLGILNFAGQRGLLNISRVIARLKRTLFRATPVMYKWLFAFKLRHESRLNQTQPPLVRVMGLC